MIPTIYIQTSSTRPGFFNASLLRKLARDKDEESSMSAKLLGQVKGEIVLLRFYPVNARQLMGSHFRGRLWPERERAGSYCTFHPGRSHGISAVVY